MYEYVASLDCHILALKLGGTSEAERHYGAHPAPIVNKIIQEAEHKGPTIVAFPYALILNGAVKS